MTGTPPLTAGASNVKLFPALVPTTALTVTLETEAVSVVGTLVVHVMLVPEVHVVVPQMSSTTALAVGVKLYEPKLRPMTVTDMPPDRPPFAGTTVLTAGPSKLYTDSPVPATAPTVTLNVPSCPRALPNTQLTLVDELQDAVLHPPAATSPDAVSSTLPKLSPLTVTELPPLNGEFTIAMHTTGASKVKANELVAVFMWTHSSLFLVVSARAVVAAPIWQVTVVAEVHDVV